jgi:hypothetical protein
MPGPSPHLLPTPARDWPNYGLKLTSRLAALTGDQRQLRSEATNVGRAEPAS